MGVQNLAPTRPVSEAQPTTSHAVLDELVSSNQLCIPHRPYTSEHPRARALPYPQ